MYLPHCSVSKKKASDPFSALAFVIVQSCRFHETGLRGKNKLYILYYIVLNNDLIFFSVQFCIFK